MRTTDNRHRSGHRGRLALAAASGLVLAGCQTVSLSDLNPFGSSTPEACPPAATLADAVNITEFGSGSSRDDSNVIYTATIQRTLFDCQVSAGRVTGRLSVIGNLDLGRKGKAGRVSLPIFIALTRNDSEIVSKRFETIEVEVAGGSSSATFDKAIPDYTFNLGGGEQTLSYEILAGFNLTPEQIDYNRKQLDG